jgi:hypothetical protein
MGGVRYKYLPPFGLTAQRLSFDPSKPRHTIAIYATKYSQDELNDAAGDEPAVFYFKIYTKDDVVRAI